MYDGPNPDIDWYLRISQAHHVTPRCPFTSVERCPRYYQSLSLLGEAGSTKIPAKEDERLRTLWEKSDLWPVTGEQATSLSGGERKTSFSEFCPEVIYDRFRIFASGLYEHVGEIDRDIAQQRLNRQGVSPTDWRWTWCAIKPMHFTECPVYSPLMHRKPSEEEILEHDRASASAILPAAARVLGRKVFVVHGHEGEPREAVAGFLRKIEFTPVILHEQSNQGRTIVEKFEAHADVDFAVVLLTPDDVGGPQGGKQQSRARQNVILELGYFIGKLGRKNVCAIKHGDLEIPSDILGVVWTAFDAYGAWKSALARELEGAGHAVDWNRAMRP